MIKIIIQFIFSIRSIQRKIRKLSTETNKCLESSPHNSRKHVLLKYILMSDILKGHELNLNLFLKMWRRKGVWDSGGGIGNTGKETGEGMPYL